MKTGQVVYENSFRKIKNENQDLIENYNGLAMDNKRIVDSLKKQKMMKSGPFKKESHGKTGELNPTPFQTYLKNKGKKHKKSTIEVQLYEI